MRRLSLTHTEKPCSSSIGQRLFMAINKILVCLICCLSITSGMATPDPVKALTQFKIDNWRTEQGLPMDLVHSLLQTKDGYFWVGTAGGLTRFDGRRFTTFEMSEAANVASQPVFGLMEDSEQTLWIAHGKGAMRYHKGVFKPAFSSEVTAGQRVYAFAQVPHLSSIIILLPNIIEDLIVG